jgi:Protein of unknown function (DUF4238)
MSSVSKERHHIIPKFYLEAFTENGKLFLIDKTLENWYPISSLNATVEKGFYALNHVEGDKVRYAEDLLSEIEGKAEPSIRRAISRQQLDSKDISNIALFISYLCQRTRKAQKQTASSIDYVRERFFKEKEVSKKLVVDKLLAADSNKLMTDLKPHPLTQYPFGYHPNLKDNPDYNLLLRFEIVGPIYDALYSQKWTFHYATGDQSFITSDNPFVLVPPKHLTHEECGVATKDAHKFIPLSRKLCLCIDGDGPLVQFDSIPDKFVDWINSMIGFQADRFIIAESREKLISVANWIYNEE